MPALARAADTFGWCYVVCWGISLYPPLLLNYRTKSVEGISIDFVWLNFGGSLLYLASVVLLFYSDVVRAEYSERNPPSAMSHAPAVPLVHFNDVFYGAHSFLLVLALLWQFYFLGYRKMRMQRVSKMVKLFLAAGVCALLMLGAQSFVAAGYKLELLDFATIFGSVKVALSAVKYVPQAWYNYSRRSIKGFAISSCIIDIVGSACCLCQLFLDSYLNNDINSGFKHPTKLLLCLVTILFSSVFLVQAAAYRGEAEEHEKSAHAPPSARKPIPRHSAALLVVTPAAPPDSPRARDPLDVDAWAPPAPRLGADELQHGAVPVQFTRREKASRPFGGALRHWSTLPALSHFMLDAISVRQKSRRVCEPHAFTRPARAAMSRQRTTAWIAQLVDSNVPLSELARAVPSSLTGLPLLRTLVDAQPPLYRALWLVQCVCASEVRAYEQQGLPQRVWCSEWTDIVLHFACEVFDERVPVPARLRYTCDLLVRLFDHEILDRQKMLQWILRGVHHGPRSRLPCMCHLAERFYRALKPTMPLLARAIALRHAAATSADEKRRVRMLFRPLLLRMAAIPDALLVPDLWAHLAPALAGSRVFASLDRRNRAFIAFDGRAVPRMGNLALLLRSFVLPYDIDALGASAHALGMPRRDLLLAVLTYYAALGTTASFVICAALLRLAACGRAGPVQNVVAEFLLDLPDVLSGLTGLVEVLVRNNLLNVDLYISRVIARELLTSAAALHLQIVRAIPLASLRPNTRSLVNMALVRAGCAIPPVDLKIYIERGLKLMDSSCGSGLLLADLPADAAVEARSQLVSQFPLKCTSHGLRRLAEYICAPGSAGDEALCALLCRAVRGGSAEVALRSLQLFSEHIATFVCGNHVESFARAVVERQQREPEFSTDSEPFALLKSVVRDPDLLLALERALPSRVRVSLAPTPAERITFTQLLAQAAVQGTNWRLSLPLLLSFADDELFLPTLRDHVAKTQEDAHNCLDKTVLLRLIAHGIVRIEHAMCDHLMMFLLFAPACEYAVPAEELELISRARTQYVAQLDFDVLLGMLSRLSTPQCAFHFAFFYSATFLEVIVPQCLTDDSKRERFLEAVGVKRDEVTPACILRMSTYFTIPFYRGVGAFVLSHRDIEPLTEEICEALVELPARCTDALASFISCACLRVKAYMLTHCINKFLRTPFDDITLRALDALNTIFGALVEGVPEPLNWTFEQVWAYYQLVAAKSSGTLDDDDAPKLCKAIVFLTQIVIMRRRKPEPGLVGLLQTLDLSPFDDRLRHFIADAILLLQRADAVPRDVPASGSSMLEGLALFSRSTKMYDPLPVFPTDLMAESCPAEAFNCRPVDLFLFETYRQDG